MQIRIHTNHARYYAPFNFAELLHECVVKDMHITEIRVSNLKSQFIDFFL